MSELSLNLTAIAIFLLTLSALLGPVVNLSPFVPAIAVVSLLGFATVDSFSWQGRGGMLVLDWIAHFSPQHRARVVRHEAGHFLVAHLLDVPVVDYSLTAWEAIRRGQPGFGGVVFNTDGLETELQRGQISAHLLERYSRIWMAGIAAEQVSYGNAEGGESDRQQLRALLSSLGQPPQQIDQRQRLAIRQAKALIEQHQPAYAALVAAMEQSQSVSECYALLATFSNACNADSGPTTEM